MSWSKPFDDVELAFIEKSYPRLSCREIARKLGRSQRGVEKAVKRMGLREPCARARPREGHDDNDAPASARGTEPSGEEMQDELSEMRELKKILKRTLRDDIDPRSMPKLSAEYREVVRRISELEEGGDGVGESTKQGVELGSLLVSVPLHPA